MTATTPSTPDSFEQKRVHSGRRSFSLVVPLFNEEHRLSRSGSEIAGFVSGLGRQSELVFVDDGSSDGTIEVARKLTRDHPECTFQIVQVVHQGKGAAVRAGIQAAKHEVVGFCDVDLATPLAEVKRLFDLAESTNILVIGSRAVGSAELVLRESWGREQLGKTFNRYVQLLVTPGITDTQCGAKVARREVWDSILPHSREAGFAWDVEIVGIARRLGIGVREVGVRWKHDYDSRVRVMRDGLSMVVAALRITRRVNQIRVQPADEEVTLEGTLLEVGGPEHWWFRSKAAYVARAISRYGPSHGTLLDVGAGAGGVTSMLGWRPGHLCIVEPSKVLVREARDRFGLQAVVGSAQSLPIPDRSMAVVSLLDVIEHLDDPVGALGEARRVIAAGGIGVITVPAHRWLWSEADEVLGHVRRYRLQDLRTELTAAGLEVRRMTHIFSWLVPPVWVVRRLGRNTRSKVGVDQRSPITSAVALVLQRLENAILRWIPLPFGTSILAVVRPLTEDELTADA